MYESEQLTVSPTARHYPPVVFPWYETELRRVKRDGGKIIIWGTELRVLMYVDGIIHYTDWSSGHNLYQPKYDDKTDITDLETFMTSYLTIKHLQSKSLFMSCVSNLYKL